MKYFLITRISILFIGCSTTIPPKSEFRVNPNIPDKKLSVMSCKDNSLKVAQAFSSNSLMSRDMNYAQGDAKQYIYAKSQWASTPNRAITDMYLKLLRETDIFNSVQVSKSRSRNDYTLEINIEDFMQYFNEESSYSNANVVITLSFIETKSSIVFASKTFSSKVDVKTLNAEGGVDALNTALSEVMSQSNEWFGEVCK